MNPGDPERCQETARLEKNRCFGDTVKSGFLSFEMTPQKLWENSGMPLDGPWTVPEIVVFRQNDS